MLKTYAGIPLSVCRIYNIHTYIYILYVYIRTFQRTAQSTGALSRYKYTASNTLSKTIERFVGRTHTSLNMRLNLLVLSASRVILPDLHRQYIRRQHPALLIVRSQCCAMYS